MKIIYLTCAFFLLAGPSLSLAQEPVNLVVNPSFEQGTQGWADFWSREKGMGKAEIVPSPVHSGTRALKVQYSGSHDWSFSQAQPFPVQPGEIYAFSGWVKCEDMAGQGQLSVVTRDAQNQVLDWMWGLKSTSGNHDWQKLSGRFVVPRGCATVEFRITGEGSGTSYWDDLDLEKAGDAPAPLSQNPVTLSFSKTRLVYSPSENLLLFSPPEGLAYRFQGLGRTTSVLRAVKTAENQLQFTLADPGGAPLSASVVLDGEGVALFSLKGEGPMDEDFEFPGPLLSSPGQNWVIPMNEGLYVPSDDPYFKAWDLVLYGGHGLCMPFVGLTSGKDGLIAIAETQDDARVRFTAPNEGKTSTWSFVWEPSRQSWWYERKLRIQWVPSGRYVGVAKAYRAYAKAHGLLVTLKEKAALNPEVDQLIGAVDLWWWKKDQSWEHDPHGEEYAKKFKKDGIERVLWAQEGSPESVNFLNQLGYLTGRYDIYQDVWKPDPARPWMNHEGWPDCLTLLPNGDWMKGWVDRDNGKDYPGGVICSACSLEMAKKKVPEDLKTHDYHARFIDTTTASPLRECYNPKHPLSRTEDRKNKMALLHYLSHDLKLVTGSETGVDMAVPHLDYFEGMMSLGPYRLADAGYDLFTRKVPQEDYKRFQMGPTYRIPLFELVYHDCVVSYWYWGDSSNRLPEYWDTRDLFNALYGTPPLWVMDPALWQESEARFIQSYKTAVPVARQTGYSEMTDHAFLTTDHSVQQTTFSNGNRVVVNFGPGSYRLEDGTTLKAKAYKVFHNGEDVK
jgi:hypothetical protein